MAYRFLLEVPEALADQAGVAVAEAGDAQVVVRRSKSHSLAYDDPYVDMTVAAHTLSVVQSLLNWYDEFRPSTPEIGLVLHSGERLSLKDQTRAGLAVAIRRDQPWVERTAPKIGEHADDVVQPAAPVAPAPAARPVAPTPESVMSQSAVAVPEAPAKPVVIRAVNHLAVRVYNLEKAEAFYTDFFAMDVVGREKQTPRGYEAVDPGFTWDGAPHDAVDVVFLQNGPLVIALHRTGLGARLERTVLDHVSLRVDATTFQRLKGNALMRGYEIVANAETEFAFRDPAGIVWEIGLAGNPAFSEPF